MNENDKHSGLVGEAVTRCNAVQQIHFKEDLSETNRLTVVSFFSDF